MLDFSSIAPHLQISVAEKIDYFDQIEFDLSSKCAKDAIHFTKNKAVMELALIDATEEDVNVYRESPDWDLVSERYLSPPWKTCKTISQVQNLPRFNVSELKINSTVSIDPFIELFDKRLIMSNELDLEWLHLNGLSPLFFTLLESFNIRLLKLENNDPLDEDLFSLPKFYSISRISFIPGEIANEKLLKLQSTRVILRGQAENRNCATANLFFQEWFTKKRNIELFEIRTNCAKTNRDLRINRINEEILFSGLPYEIIWKYRERNYSGIIFPDYGLLKQIDLYSECDDNMFEEYMLDEDVTVYSIDRGDKKLLVYIGADKYEEEFTDFLQAQEYTELNDIFSVTLDVK